MNIKKLCCKCIQCSFFYSTDKFFIAILTKKIKTQIIFIIVKLYKILKNINFGNKCIKINALM